MGPMRVAALAGVLLCALLPLRSQNRDVDRTIEAIESAMENGDRSGASRLLAEKRPIGRFAAVSRGIGAVSTGGGTFQSTRGHPRPAVGGGGGAGGLSAGSRSFTRTHAGVAESGAGMPTHERSGCCRDI